MVPGTGREFPGQSLSVSAQSGDLLAQQRLISTMCVGGTSLWVWQRMNQSTLVNLAEENGVKRLLVWVSAGFSKTASELTRYRQLRNLAAEKGIHLDALGGDPGWSLQPKLSTTWAKEVAGSKLFERLHLDIEPYALSAWTTQRDSTVRGYLAALSGAVRAGIPVDADIPHWFWKISGASGSTLDVEVMRLVDTVTIMAYQNTWQRVISVVTSELQAAATLGETAVVGVNLAPPAASEPTSSFWGQTAAAFQNSFSMVSTEAASIPGFGGMAIHDADSLKSLSPGLALCTTAANLGICCDGLHLPLV
jgi:hypothetical protein